MSQAFLERWMMTASHERPSVNLPDQLLDQLQIPSVNKAQFRLSVDGLVRRTFRQKEEHLRAGQISGPLKHLAVLSSRVARILMVANEGQDKIALAVKDRLEHELRYAADRPTSLSYPDGIDLLAFHGDLAEFLCNACKRASASANTNHGARGGKPGLKGHSGLLSFIQHVVTRVLRAGGQLPHQKASPELIALLEAL